MLTIIQLATRKEMIIIIATHLALDTFIGLLFIGSDK